MRARSIKPGFFKNEKLGELPPLARLLFIGLWCLADREGRLEDRPKRIKAEIMPYEEGLDCDALLNKLQESGFILRYGRSEDEAYIQIINFDKHQTPHRNETQSVIPQYDTQHFTQRAEHVDPRTAALATKDRSARACILDPCILDITPLSPNGDIPPAGGETMVEQDCDSYADTQDDVAQRLDELRRRWNETAEQHGLPAIMRLTDKRRRAATARLRDRSWWESYPQALKAIGESDFCCGRVGTWKANFDWFIKPATVTKLLEGQYSNTRGSPRNQPETLSYVGQLPESERRFEW